MNKKLYNSRFIFSTNYGESFFTMRKDIAYGLVLEPDSMVNIDGYNFIIKQVIHHIDANLISYYMDLLYMLDMEFKKSYEHFIKLNWHATDFEERTDQ